MKILNFLSLAALAAATLLTLSSKAQTPVEAQTPAEAQAEPPAETVAPAETEPPAETEAPAELPAMQPAGPLDLFITSSRAQLAAGGFVRQLAFAKGYRFIWWEKGSGPSLVMIHGVADQAGTWVQVAAALAENHRVLLVDLPGHGESEPTEGPLPMTTVVEGFEAWLSRHGRGPDKKPATLVGNSMGAWVALLAAKRQTELVSRVVLVNGGPFRRSEDGADTDGLDLVPKDREEARRLMAALRDPSSPPTPDPVLDDLVRRAKNGEVSRMSAEQQNLESYLMNERGLGTITTPVDILWGSSDRYLGEEYPKNLEAGLARSRLTMIPKCGHLPQAECPAQFLELLQQVLKKKTKR